MLEEKIQEQVEDLLVEAELFPRSVIFTYQLGGILGITFYNEEDLQELYDRLGIVHICDSAGFQLFWDTKTILVRSGWPMETLINNLKDDE